MVKICSDPYTKNNDYINKYTFELSSFQKYAIEAITEGNNALITAHTGSGKTLPAEFAIEYFTEKKKKVIYTSPIKALSNQKYYEFTRKFPNISFGILTGDIKFNPDADVLIMTTEILQNTLFKKDNKNKQLLFEMDIDNDLACVIFDEVHYINDKERGRVWEETIMLLPNHVQMLMLSATIDSPELFALWGESQNPTKDVYLITTYHRVVPLTHYNFVTSNSAIFKAIKDKAIQQEIRDYINKIHVIQDSTGNFNEINYYKMKKILTLFKNNNVFVKRQHVLNEVTAYMKENNMLPALCFVLSRNQLEIMANEVTTVLLEDDSKVPYIIKDECYQILKKLPNYKEYLELEEYQNIIKLLEKGIGIHHAGIIPIFREMIELLYSKGYIKILFATETFSVGINMPTKSVIFTNHTKFDGLENRVLLPHEYTQMAGRAGRRGIDTLGYVIHLNNLFKDIELLSYRDMLKGKPQKLNSKFKLSYNLVLNLLNNNGNFDSFTDKSMLNQYIKNQSKICDNNIEKVKILLQKEQEAIKALRTPLETINEYLDLQKLKLTVNNNKKRSIDKNINSIIDFNKSIESDSKIILQNINTNNSLLEYEKESYNLKNYFTYDLDKILELFKNENIIDENNQLTTKGHIASCFKEVNCIVFANLINEFDNYSIQELIAIFSCFTNVSIEKTISKDIEIISRIEKMHELYSDSSNYIIHTELYNYILKWCDSTTNEECKSILQLLNTEKQIYTGEFIKAILKINNIASELEAALELTGNISLLSKIKQIPDLTLKYVATNSSLYI